MAAPAFDSRAIERLDQQVREHKAEAKRHRMAAREAAAQRDRLIEFCRANNIPYRMQAQPREARPND